MAGKFEPKVPVDLDPPRDDPISPAELAKTTGVDGAKCYVAIKGKVYDVTGNKAYQPGGSYHGMLSLTYPGHISLPHLGPPWKLIDAVMEPVFAGKDASRALGKTSTKPEDVQAEWQDLPDKEKSTLDDWVTFFSKRYNVVGVVEGATNMG